MTKKNLLVELTNAINENNLEKVLAITGSDVNATFGVARQTALQIATRAGCTDIVRSLLIRGANPNKQDKAGTTPFHEALRQQHLTVLQLLLDAGADVDLDITTQNNSGALQRMYPLKYAVKFGGEALISLLLQYGAIPWIADESTGSQANKNLIIEVKDLAQALKKVVDESSIDEISPLIDTSPIKVINIPIDSSGKTALFQAVCKASPNLAEIRLLLDKGANPDIRASRGSSSSSSSLGLRFGPPKLDSKKHQQSTPLHMAAIQGNQAVVELLLNNHAQIDNKDADGYTPLYYALINGHIAVVDLLFSRGANVHCLSGSPLFNIIQNKHGLSEEKQLSMITLLLQCGANPWCEAEDADSGSYLSPAEFCPEDSTLAALFHNVEQSLLRLKTAVETNQIATVEDILRDAPISIINTPLLRNGQTALHFAQTPEMILCLSRHGAEATRVDTKGRSALHIMSRSNNSACVEQLTTVYPELVHQVDQTGQTALHVAATYGHMESAGILLNHKANPKEKDRKGKTAVDLAEKHGQIELVKEMSEPEAACSTSGTGIFQADSTFFAVKKYRTSFVTSSCRSSVVWK